MLMVLAFGLKASTSDALFLFRRPALLARALLSVDVIVPLVTVALAASFSLARPVKIALITLALAPLPPLFFKKPLKAGARMSYTIGLFVALTLVAVVFIPFAIDLLTKVTGLPLQMSMAAVWTLVFTSLLLPLVAGIIINHLAPSFAERLSQPALLVATVLLILAVVPIFIRVWPAMVSLIGNGTLAAMIVLAIVAVATGHLLGGPETDDRTALALASATRHPGIAIAIAQVNFPDQKLAPAAILLYLVVSAIVTIPYLKWVAHQRAGRIGEVSPRVA